MCRVIAFTLVRSAKVATPHPLRGSSPLGEPFLYPIYQAPPHMAQLPWAGYFIAQNSKAILLHFVKKNLNQQEIN